MTVTVSPFKIVYYTSWFFKKKFEQDLKLGNDCPIPEGYAINYTGSDTTAWCTLTSSKDHVDDAAALMFHAMDVFQKPEHKKNQPWVLESLESPFSSSFRTRPESMKDYQYLASYNFKSAFLFSYYSPDIMNLANRPLPNNFMKTKTGKAPILWIASNCHATNGRQEYIKELMKYVDVHSYGHCLNNQPFPKDKNRMDLLKEYKFYLSMENANCDDYVTEKLYDTFMMSTVPIVDGPSNYGGYLPSNRSVIYADAYPNPKDLADYINYLNTNDTAYLEYLSFRQHALDIAPKDRLGSDFIGNWSDPSLHLERTNYCSVCRGMLPWWSHRSGPTEAEEYIDPNRNTTFLADQSCSASGKWNYVTNGPPYQPSWEPRIRDEFTRPVISLYSTTGQHSNSTLLSIVSGKLAQEAQNITFDPVVVANAIFVCLYLVFIFILIRISRKSSDAYAQLPPMSSV